MLRLRVLGVPVDVRTPDAPTRERLAHQWARAVRTDGEEAVAVVDATGGPPGEEEQRDYLLTTQVTLAALEATTGSRVNLHAGGLADTDGRVLAVVGASGTGKTTATRLLATRLGYLSDETVSITPEGTVHPHPKPLSVVVDPQSPRHKHQLSPDDLGLLPTPEQGSLARIVVLRRGVAEPRGIVPLTLPEGLLALIEQSSSLGRITAPLPTLVALVDSCEGVFALEYDEVADHLDALTGLLTWTPDDSSPTPLPHGSVVRHAPPSASEQATPATGEVGRAVWVDAVEVDDEVVVLLDGTVVHVAGLTASCWLLLAEPRTADALVAAARELHGDHPDAASLVARAVDSLVERGLVVHGPLA